MRRELLPLFPLNVVLFPRTPLPLHIFEERYKELIANVIQERSEFGVVLMREKGIVNVGCTATVETVVKRYEDGRLDILTVGRRRFEVILLNEEKSYLRGPVEFFEDEQSEPVPVELYQRAIDAYNEFRTVSQEELPVEPDTTDSQLSFQLAQFVPDLDFRQTLLAMRSEKERMKRLAEFLEGYVPRLRYITHVQAMAARNGHGRRPSEIEDSA
jgi:Lon protease-like protein